MNNFPVKTINSASFDVMWAKALREGTNAGFEINGTGTIPVSGNNLFSSGTLNSCTEYMLIESIMVSAIGGGGAIQLQFSSGIENGITGSQIFRTALLNNAVSIPIKKLISPAAAYALLGWFGEGAIPTRAIVYLSGIKITADLNFNAEKVILWIGDSIVRGTSIGGTSLTGGGGSGSNLQTAVKPTDHFTFQVRDNFQRRSIDCRLILKAMGGFNSIDINACIQEGFLDVEKADVIFYQIGTNDAIAGSGVVSDVLFGENLDKIIDFKIRKFPKSKLVFVGATPLNNSTYEARLVQLRAIMAAKASSVDNIYYLSLESCFDRTVLTNYNLSDGIHPNIANNILMANTINNWVDSNEFIF